MVQPEVPNKSVDNREGGPLYRILLLTVTALAVGFAASFAAILFVEIVLWLNDVLLVSPRTRVQNEEPSWLVPVATVTVPALGGLLTGILLQNRFKKMRPLGPPDVIQAVQFRQPLADTRSGIVSTAAAAVSLGFGASVGQYGPMVYLGAVLGGLVSRFRLRIANLPAIAVACGVAAAISTAFNAPVAGLVFAHEVVLRHYSTQAFAPTTIAAAAGYVVANVVFERPALFLVNFSGVANGHEFVLFGILGVLSAGLAIMFMHAVLGSARLAGQTPIPPALRPAGAGLLLGITALWLPEILGIGREMLRFTTIEGAFDLTELPLLLCAKVALTALCVGFGFAGGVFSPALLIGALFGTLFWMVVTSTTDVATSGVAVYAICGMMAVTSSVIGAPLTTILIVFELTRNYDITIAAMVAIVMANLVSHRVFGRSLYDVQLARRGIDLSLGRDHARLDAVAVTVYCDTEYPRIQADDDASKAYELMTDSGRHEFFVTDTEGRFLGVFSSAREGSNAADCATAPLGMFNESTSVAEALVQFEAFNVEAVPVVQSDTGQLLGAVTGPVLVHASQDIANQLRREENASL